MERLKLFCWGLPGLLVWMTAVGLLASRLTVSWAVATAVLGAVTGFAVSGSLARGSVRLPVLWVAGGIGLLASRWTAEALRTHYAVAAFVGAERCFVMSEMLAWFLLVGIVLTVVMASSRRRPAFLVLEAGLVAAIVASIFAPHRDGMISRPYFLVDPLWGRGYDPLPVFLGLGALLAGVLVLLLASRQPERRSYPALIMLMVAVLLVFVFLPTHRLKDLPQLLQGQGSPSPSASAGRGSGQDGETPRPSPPPGAPGGEQGPTSSPRPPQDGPGASPSARPSGQPRQDGPGASPSARPSGQPGQDGPGASPSAQPSGQPRRDGPGASPSAQPSGRPRQDGPGASPSAQPSGQPGQEGPGASPSAQPSGEPRQEGPGGSPSPQPSGQPQQGSSPSPEPSGQASSSPMPATSEGKGGSAGGGRPTEIKDLEVRSESRHGASQPVAVVLLKDDYEPPEGLYYFRQTVFSQWNGQGLVRDQSGRYDRDVAENFPEGPLEVACEAPPSKVMRPLESVVALLTSHTRPFGLLSPTRFESTENPDPRRFQRAYLVQSRVPTQPLRSLLGRAAGTKVWPRDAWLHYTDGPADPRYKKLAREATRTLKPGFGSDPLARALAIRMLLEKTGTYDLHNRYEGSSDPVGDFLFGQRVGYCVHFSRAAVLLFRSLGIPARVGAGYAVDARGKGRGSAILIRGGESHAWPEIYLDGLGWVVVDISPAKSVVPPVPPPDPDTQQMMGDMARNKQQKPPEEEKPAGDGDLQKAVRQLLSAIVDHLWWLVVLALAVLYGVKSWRRLAPYVSGPRPSVTLYYRAALDALADSGRVRPHGETREGFARNLDEVSPAFARLTHLHLQEQLDHKSRQVTTDPQALRELYSDARREISSHTSLLRRVVGFVDPFSWWRVR